MANKAINSTSGFRPRSEEKAEMQHQHQEGNETSSNSSFDANVRAQRLASRFRTIDSWELDGSTYIGEGNATLVVSLPHERKVLRFRKTQNGSGEESDEDSEKRKFELVVDFYKNFISGLMGSYTTEPEIVRCNPEDVIQRMSLFETQRPEHRRHKNVVQTYATILPDYTLLPGYMHDKLLTCEKRPTFCIEIKPKQGFVDKEVLLLRGKCDYCRKQHSKLADGKISTVSKYCPCDLFSGEIIRMRRAIKGLVDSPQNNFKIFKNGRLVWGEGFAPQELDKVLAEWFFYGKPFNKEAANEAMFQLIYEALLRPLPLKQLDLITNETKKLNNKTSKESLPRDSVLDRILRVQRINKYSIDFVYNIYSAYSRILNDEIIYSNSTAILSRDKNLPSAEEILILRNYLLFRLAKDCSILVAFEEIDPSMITVVSTNRIIHILESRCFLFNTAITDLDPKSVHSIAKHHNRQNAEIFKVTE